jgi:hypothetical protein
MRTGGTFVDFKRLNLGGGCAPPTMRWLFIGLRFIFRAID